MRNSQLPQIDVAIAICTYARQTDLELLLSSIRGLEIDDRIAPRVIVVDNDIRKSAQPVVDRFRNSAPCPVHYVHETQPGIPFARNRALAEAGDGGYLAFVDDDETVDPQWLNELVNVALQTRAAFVQGPLLMTVEDTRDGWWLRSGFFRQKEFSNFSHRSESWTNNVLIDLAFVARAGCRFDPQLRFDGGSDTLFFADLVAAGGTGRFASKAIVYEIQKKNRLTWKWATLRQYRYGITRANVVLLRKSTGFAGLYCTMRGMVMIGLGVVQLPRALVRGRAGLGDGIALIARGAGVISGLFGGQRREYAR
ncbi:glycosyltransferase family 2 protein [Marivita sp. GX14005]|uniref:glycosyltransferase family 2 protein n=1 Tax=Marivita sp. GX14005 TaxID=2942276 RepID=UPI00201937A2|nr:glycosyltransferase family 2 protein [Marivita sp. GX14005]MCL3881724.1 glycosyltransferase family 2 protein [Marivita sp. GX14005]